MTSIWHQDATEMLYGYDCYGELVEQAEPQHGQAFKGIDGVGFFLGWDDMTGFARLVNAAGKQYLVQPCYLSWLPAQNMPKQRLEVSA